MNGEYDDFTPLGKVKLLIHGWLQKGGGRHLCPACGQDIQLCRRKLNSGMAWALWRLYRWDWFHPGQEMDYRNRRARGEARDHPLLRFFGAEGEEGLIEHGPSGRGFWQITDAGRDFVARGTKVVKAIWHFDGRCYDRTKGKTTMARALRDKFDLAELLASLPERGD